MKHGLLVLSAAVLTSTAAILYSPGANAQRARLAVTPTPTPQSVKAAKSKGTPVPTPTPSASPTPQPIASPAPKAKGLTSVADLQQHIRQLISAPDIARGRVGVKITSLNTGKVIFENDADKYFIPASNMKNFTVAAALEKLGPDFKFVTSVYGQKPDANGTVKGDLRIYGRGDITISTSFFGTSPSDPETYYKGIDRLVDVIAAAGVKRVEGDLIGDESYFKGFAVPTTWEWDDLQWKDGSEISALPINDNDVDLTVKPGQAGAPCIVKITPVNAIYRMEDHCLTTSPGTDRQLVVNKRIDQNWLVVGGSIPADDKGFTGVLTFSHPADLFVAILKERLANRGIVVAGQTRTVGGFADSIRGTRSFPGGNMEIAKLESPPYSLVAAKTMKPSQNMYAETILWTLGEGTKPPVVADDVTLSNAIKPARTEKDSSELGLQKAKEFRTQIGIPADAVLQYDGSGMSRHDEITPSSIIQLYTYMAKQSKYAQVWRDSLSIGGVDGTLRNRFKGTTAEGNMRGKTGTLDQVSALSGYVTTAAGEQLVVSILVNGVPEPRRRTGLADAIVIDLANFAGKFDQ